MDRDPYQPFDRQPAPPVVVEHYAPPKGANSKWIALLGVAVVAILAVFLVPQFLPTTTPTAPATTSPAAPKTTIDSEPPSTNGIPVEGTGYAGYWSIDSYEWAPEGLLVKTTLRIDRGTLGFSFFSFDSQTNQPVDPAYRVQDLQPGTVSAGQSVSGTLLFKLHRGDTTIILANNLGRQITALRVSQ